MNYQLFEGFCIAPDQTKNYSLDRACGWKLTISWHLSHSRFLIADMSVKVIVSLDFMVEGFTWKTVITVSSTSFLSSW